MPKSDFFSQFSVLFLLMTLSGNIEAVNKSEGSTSRASAMDSKVSNVKLCGRLGASTALIRERLIFAFAASSSYDIPRTLRKVDIAIPIWKKRSRW